MAESTGGFDSTERASQDSGMEPGSGTDTGLDPTKGDDGDSGGMEGEAEGQPKDPQTGQGGDASESSSQDPQGGSAARP